jgi:hypothetical protein
VGREVSNIVEFPREFDGTATEFALEDAKGKFDRLLIIGVEADGDISLKSSIENKMEILWCLEVVKKAVLDAEWDDE